MIFNSNFIPIIIAGIMNGSFVIPMKYVKNFSEEKIWLYHSVIGVAIIPWIILIFTLSSEVSNYLLLSPNTWIYILLGGIIFGLGQVCFAFAIECIGVALSFAINLGLGATIGSLFVIFYKNIFFTSQGYLTTLAVFLVVASLFTYYHAVKDVAEQSQSDHKNYHKGWLLASLAGFGSGLQNITFMMAAFYSQTKFQTSNSFWVWPPFLLMAAIPMFIGFYYKLKKIPVISINQNENHVTSNIFLIILMGLFFTGSLALYSYGMNHLTERQQILGWPTLMISIILMSQVWGAIYKEFNNISRKNGFYRIGSIILLIGSITILAFLI